MELLFLAAGWLVFAAVHSLLAAQCSKRWIVFHWPWLARGYRLAYNLLAFMTVLPLLWASSTLSGPWWWRWTGHWAWLADGLAGAALLALFLSARSYDLAEFLGLRAWRERRMQAIDGDRFRLSVWHRYVRHPWYALAMVLIWTRDMNAPMFVSALAASLYFIIGARLEEKKLEARFGTLYTEYRRRVPAFVPRPWRYLTPEAAEALLRNHRSSSVV